VPFSRAAHRAAPLSSAAMLALHRPTLLVLSLIATLLLLVALLLG
jgi:hypothetical protein